MDNKYIVIFLRTICTCSKLTLRQSKKLTNKSQRMCLGNKSRPPLLTLPILPVHKAFKNRGRNSDA